MALRRGGGAGGITMSSSFSKASSLIEPFHRPTCSVGSGASGRVREVRPPSRAIDATRRTIVANCRRVVGQILQPAGARRNAGFAQIHCQPHIWHVVYQPYNFPMPQRFQFSVKRIFVATTLVAVGLGLFRLPNPFPRLLSIWFTFSCALFGAAIGVICDQILRLAFYGFIGAVAFIIYAWIT